MSDETNEKADRMLRWAVGEPTGPFSISLGVTHMCNLRCVFCPQDVEPGALERELSQERLVGLVREAAEMDVRVINVSGGGEPFFRKKKTLAVMRAIKEGNMGGGTSTNGTLFDDWVIEDLVDMEWDALFFSIDAPDAETNDYLRNKPGAFENSVSAAKRFRECREKQGKTGPSIFLQTVLNQRNREKLAGMVELAYEVGAKGITYIPLIVRTPEGERLRMSEADNGALHEAALDAKEVAERLGIETNLDDFIDPRYFAKANAMDEVILADADEVSEEVEGDSGYISLPCFEPWVTLVIHPYGHIDPCEYESNLAHVEERSLREIWFEDAHLNRVRAALLEKKLTGFCSGCCEPVVMRNQQLRQLLKDRVLDDPGLRARLMGRER